MERGPERHRAVRAPQDFWAGVSLVALAAFSFWAGRALDSGTLRSMGPGMMPRAVALLMAGIGVGLVVASFLRAGDALERWSFRGVIFIMLGVVAFALTIRSPGLVVAGPLVCIVAGVSSPEARVKELAVFGVVMTALCVGLFRYALHLPIPILVIPGVVVL
ncbi:MAG TPA: tripartite tricarboxylate transporter TctB family protein [Anaeromyxobacteraceae bacterium]|nr:tripartite tricarboxylate transporter TctB family protein [Anaeromyxobacteraceae bacterium]